MAHNEVVFTPGYIVELILNEIGYTTDCYENQEENRIRRRHIIDNSCGDGRFLCEVVRRYFQQSIVDGLENGETVKESNQRLREELETYIHGIELQSNLVGLTVEALDKVVEEFIDPNVFGKVNWDVRCGDALDVHDFDGKMDYVVGNPPYCNVHHFGEKYEKYKQFSFMQTGMSDLYLLFFELGFNMLSAQGKLAYITPNSWFTSVAGRPLREHILKYHNLYKIIQCGHEQVFKGATTFSAISFFNNKGFFRRYAHIKWKGLEDCWDDNIDWNSINYECCFIDGKLYLADFYTLNRLNKILTSPKKQVYSVKNGFATLKDKLFTKIEWKDVTFPKGLIFAIKASTGELTKMFFPYNNDGKPITWEDFPQELRDYMIDRARELEVDVSKEGWYLYGRYQGIKDVFRQQISVSQFINNDCQYCTGLNIWPMPAGTGVYGGLYVVLNTTDDRELTDEEYDKFVENINQKLRSKEFFDYVKALGHYKNGGYYTFTSKELENFLNF